MKSVDEVIDWNKYLRYEDGKLYWKEREGNHWTVKRFNKQFVDVEAGTIKKCGYMQITFLNKSYRLHKVVWEMHNGKIPEHLQIDHINANKQDNRIENLQLVTAKHNSQRRGLMIAKGYRKSKRHLVRPYQANRTWKMFGTPCGAYMSFATAFVQGEMNGDSR